jgi:hypothetical protein
LPESISLWNNIGMCFFEKKKYVAVSPLSIDNLIVMSKTSQFCPNFSNSYIIQCVVFFISDY